MQLLPPRPTLRPDLPVCTRPCLRSHTAVPPCVEDRSSGAVLGRCRGAGGSELRALPPFSPEQEGPEGGAGQSPDFALAPELFLPAIGAALDWRTFRALLIYNEHRLAALSDEALLQSLRKASTRQPDQWAHLLAQPEKGCLLVARDTDAASDAEQSVVLLCNHEAEGGTGTSYGFYLNRPWRRRRASGLNLRDGLADAFKERTVYHGGIVSNRHIHVIHTCSQVQGSHEILEGVYSGGLPHANALVKAGHVAVHRFKLVAGYMGWDAGQLAREVDDGKWWAVAASAPLIVSFIQGACPEETVGGEHEAMWHEVLNLAGVPVGSLKLKHNSRSLGVDDAFVSFATS